VTDSLAVAVNRDGLHTLDVPPSFEAAGPFTVEVRNYGEAAHIHLNLDDQLSEVATVRATNHYVEGGERRLIDIEIRDPSAWPAETIRGKLKVVVAHGQRTRYVDVDLDRSAVKSEVRVDPDLGTPDAGRDSELPPMVRLLPIIALGSVAVILAVGALFAAENLAILLGIFSLVSAGLCAVAAYVLLG